MDILMDFIFQKLLYLKLEIVKISIRHRKYIDRKMYLDFELKKMLTYNF